jgi:hypothetical protein
MAVYNNVDDNNVVVCVISTRMRITTLHYWDLAVLMEYTEQYRMMDSRIAQ